MKSGDVGVRVLPLTQVNDLKAACYEAKLFRPCPEAPNNKAQAPCVQLPTGVSACRVV